MCLVCNEYEEDCCCEQPCFQESPWEVVEDGVHLPVFRASYGTTKA